jgi:hypothetical protein
LIAAWSTAATCCVTENGASVGTNKEVVLTDSEDHVILFSSLSICEP